MNLVNLVLKEVNMDFYKEILEKFNKEHIDKSDCDFIFCEVLNCKRTEILIKLKNLTNKQKKLIIKATEKRLKKIPISQIFNKAYFYGEQFYVNKNVLCPRLETELLVEKSNNIIRLKSYNSALDLCTGSGIIAIMLKKLNTINLVASDISKSALMVAKKNAKIHKTKIKFIKSDLFNNIKSKFDLIVSNPPYIKTNEINFLEEEVKNFDPTIALDGKSDGLYYYRQICAYVDKYLNKNGTLILEIGYNQGKDVKNLFESKFNNVMIIKDYSDNDRIVICENLK